LFGIAGAIAGIFDYFVGGGQPDPRPTYFGMNLELSGTITTTYVAQVPMSIVVPGSKSDALQQPNAGSFVPVVYNQPMGLLNLTETPRIKYKEYQQSIRVVPLDPVTYYVIRKNGMIFKFKTLLIKLILIQVWN
jgi:hypothetical protein